MKNIKRINLLIISLLVSIMAVSVSNAQNTASAIRGTVADSEGNVLSGATVVIKHIPTGSTKTMTTNSSGNYQARGLRVGGPYSVTISNPGYNTGSQDDVYITLGEIKDVDVAIAAESYDVEEVVVFGKVTETIFSADTMGSGISIGSETIETAPTISRDVTDFIRLDSRINLRDNGGFSVSGVNNRSNNFSIDGVSANDPFGLEANGFAGLGQPFNIDTIDQLNIQLSPYDVTLSNFTGANINAVTKSGTNEFTGSVNYQYGNESWSRDLDDFTNTQLSATLGGPIIKDKLFFFVGLEDTSRTRVANSSNVTDTVVQAVIDAAQSNYGVDIGSLSPPGELDSTKENLLMKVDWVINEDHRMSLKYNTNEDNSPQLPGTFSSGRSTSSHWYANNYQSDTFAVNLYSDWSDNFNTEVRISSSEFDKVPVGVIGDLSNLAFVEILNLGLDCNGSVITDGDDVDCADGTTAQANESVFFGRERFRHANSLSTKTNNFYIEGNYFVGDHTIKAGIDIQNNDIFNVFLSDALGNYQFSNLDDFINGDVNRYRFNVGVDPNEPAPAADWSWKNTGLFIQDNWLVNDQLTVQYGLRWDKPSTSDAPLLNPGFEEAFGYSNQNVIDTGVLQPRIGFNYDMSDEYSMQLRGGVGIFSGGSPNVWLSNPFTNPGGNVNSYQIFGYDTYIPDGLNQVDPGATNPPAQNVDVLAPGFKMPTVLKSNLAFDAELPWYGLQATVEYEYTQQRNGIFYKNLNLGEPTGFLPDGRVSYYADPMGDVSSGNGPANSNPAFNNVMELSNSGEGDTRRATISLEKKTDHFFIKGSYTHTSTSEVSPGTSSRAISNWTNTPIYNVNSQEVGISNYQIGNAFTLVAAYNNNFFGDTMTDISAVWTSVDGEPYSYTYDRDINGDGVWDNDLFYVPNADEYVMDDPSEREAFEAYLVASGLDQYRGQIPTRNSFKAPRINQIDLKIKQELPAWGMFRASVFVSIKNLGNMINDDWGTVYTGSFDGIDIAELDGFDGQGRAILDFEGFDGNDDGVYTVEEQLSRRTVNSQWQAQVGIRIDF